MCKNLYYIIGCITCILLVMGYGVSWIEYNDNNVYVNIDIYSRSVCTGHTCIRSTDLPHSCRNMEMLYIFGSFALIVIISVQLCVIYTGDNVGWKVIVLSILSFSFLIGSYISIKPCMQDWGVLLYPTIYLYCLVVWTSLSLIFVIVYLLYRLYYIIYSSDDINYIINV